MTCFSSCHLLSIGAFLFLGMGQSMGQQYNLINASIEDNLRYVEEVGNNQFVAVADHRFVGQITVFRNQGNWQRWRPMGSDRESVWDIQFLNANVGYYITRDGIIAKTTDGGASWSEQFNAAPEQFNDLHLVNSATGWVTTNSGRVLFTDDGGAAWNPVYVDNQGSPILSVQFLDADEGFAQFGSGLHHTSDGGVTWNSIDPGGGLFANALHFLDENTGFITNNIGQRILFTDDGGQTWTEQLNTAGTTLTTIEVDANGAGIALSAGDSVVYTTQDNGNSWTRQDQFPGRELRVARLLSDGSFLVGAGLWLYHSTDGGATWTVVNEALAGTSFADLHHRADGTTLMIGSNGRIVLTSDRDSFRTVESGVQSFLWRMEFPTENVGHVVGNDGTILRTTDGGETWISQSIDTNITWRDIAFPTPTTGYITGWAGSTTPFTAAALITTDGGNSWQFLNLPDSLELIREVEAPTADTLYITDLTGSLLRSDDGGNSWTQIPDTFDFMANMAFLTPQQGFIIADWQFYKTTDGGQTWEPGFSKLGIIYEGLGFHDAQRGAIAGYRINTPVDFTNWEGYFFVTNDGGQTWARDSNQYYQALLEVGYHPNGRWYAVGTAGVLVEFDGTPLSVEHPLNVTDALELTVFPNPFSETLTLRWPEPASEDGAAFITLYDLQGRAVMEESVRFSEGTARLNTAELPAGYYTYRLQNGRGATAAGKVVRMP